MGTVALVNGEIPEAVAAFALGGSLVGFLVFNFQPASIFMGDTGSLFIGFTLALLATRLKPEVGAGGTWAVLMPAAILSVPIFDTTLVTFLRGLAGRRVSTGGRDPSSHRLVALGLPERRAVLVLYGCAGVAAVAGLSAYFLDVSHANILLGFFFVGLMFFGIHLAHVRVYDAKDVNEAGVQQTVALALRSVG